MSMFTLAISCLTTSNLPWFVGLTFQVPMQYCSLQHQTLLSPSDISTTGCCFCFDLASSLFLELLVIALCSSPVAYWTPSDLGGLIFWSHIFLPFYTVHGVFTPRILEWFAISSSSGPFCQNSPLWPDHLAWPCMAWLMASLSYTSPFAVTK